jgi:hypothetical protein
MPNNIVAMFPREDAFTNRPVPANFSRGPQEAPIWLDAMPEDCGPTVNPRAPKDEALFEIDTREVWLMLLAVSAVMAFVICGAAYMGVAV